MYKLLYVMLCNSEQYRREKDGNNKLFTGKIHWVRMSVTAPVSRVGLAMVMMEFRSDADSSPLVVVRRMVGWDLEPCPCPAFSPLDHQPACVALLTLRRS